MTCLACLLITAAIYGQEEPSKPDEAAIRALVTRYVQARNNKNAEATRSLFTDDADQLVSTGEWRKGIDNLVNGAMATSRKEASKSSVTVESIRFLEPHVAIVDGRYQTAIAGSQVIRKMWTTLVVKQTAAGWRIAAIRNMLPAAPNTPGAPH